MKKKSLLKNYFYNLAYQILELFLPLITIPYVSRILGAEKIGIYSYTISITTYFVTFSALGMALYGQREVAYAQDNKRNYSKIFREIITLRFLTLIIALCVYYPVFVLGGGDYGMYYAILILEIIGGACDISWFFRGLEEFKLTVIRNTIVKLISTISIFVFIKTPDDLWKYFLIYVLSILLGNGTLWLYLPKYLEKIKITTSGIFRHLRPTLVLFVPQIAVQVYTLLDKTMIGAIVDDKSEVGFYDQSQKIIKVILAIITSFGAVMMPRIAHIFAKGEHEKIQKYINNSLRAVLLISLPMIAGIIVVSDSFVPLFFGEGFDEVSILMKVISPIILLIGVSNVSGTQYLLPTKRQKEYNTSIICGAVVNFMFNLILIPKIGALGASIATVIAELSVTSTQLVFARKEIRLIKVAADSRVYFLASALIVLIGIFIQKALGNGIATIILQSCAGVVIYVVALLISKDGLARRILKKVIKNNTAKISE